MNGDSLDIFYGIMEASRLSLMEICWFDLGRGIALNFDVPLLEEVVAGATSCELSSFFLVNYLESEIFFRFGPSFLASSKARRSFSSFSAKIRFLSASFLSS